MSPSGEYSCMTARYTAVTSRTRDHLFLFIPIPLSGITTGPQWLPAPSRGIGQLMTTTGHHRADALESAPSDDRTDAGGIVRTTVTLSDELIANAQELTGITERTELLRAGLETLVRVESARRLAALGGSDRKASAAPRRRSASQ